MVLSFCRICICLEGSGEMFKGNKGNVNIVRGNLLEREKVWGGV